MEIPIQVAVRIRPPDTLPAAAKRNPNNNAYDDDLVVVKSIPGTATQHDDDADNNDDAPASAAMPTPGIVQVASPTEPDAPPASFPFAYALPADCAQERLYVQCVYPMLGMYMEGFDASFVTYGQRGTGKTYTMIGRAPPAATTAIADRADRAAELDADGERHAGIVQRWVRDLFALLSMHADRNYVLNIGWVEVLDDEIHDLLDNSGNVPCATVADVWHWLRVGLGNRAAVAAEAAAAVERDGELRGAPPPVVHSIFTITLEQHWVSEGLIQHRLSTASFCDLAATGRRDVRQRDEAGAETDTVLAHGVPEDTGLQVLDEIVDELAASPDYASGREPPYPRTTLTTLLKDSFGGRAQTLLILCVSALAADCNETLHNLRFAYRSQCIRNLVVLNAFSDNNRPLASALEAAALAVAGDSGAAALGGTDLNGNGRLLGEPTGICLLNNGEIGVPGVGADGSGAAATAFGMQFAAAQWLKLVSNAEGLFSRLIASESLGEKERERIEEWMFLKQECHDCLSSGELPLPLMGGGGADGGGDGDQRLLGPIQEESSEPEGELEGDEDDNDDDDDEVDDEDDDDDDDDVDESTSCQQNTDSDSESQQLEYLHDRMAQLMDEFRHKTDNMVTDKYDAFVGRQPNAVLHSQDGVQPERAAATATATNDSKAPDANGPSPAAATAVAPRSGRRKSIQPGDNQAALTSFDLARLAAVAGAHDNALSIDPTALAALAAHPVDPSSSTSCTADEFQLLLLRSSTGRDPLDKLDGELRKVRTNVLAAEQHAAELTGTIQTTGELVQTLERRTAVPNKMGYHKKRAKLEADCAKGEKVLGKALTAAAKSGAGSAAVAEVDRLRALVAAKQQMYAEFVSLNSSAELQLKCKEHQKGLKVAKKKLEAVQKVLKKNRKREADLVDERVKLAVKAVTAAAVAPAEASGSGGTGTTAKPAKSNPLDARISHLDQVIKEKSQTLKQFAAAGGDGGAANSELYRHEIRQLRRTRDELLDRRCSIDQLKRHKRLTPAEQRRLFECDESIEAIDAVIEYKNELLCGDRRSVDTSEAAQRERAGRLMMARLNKLSVDEMRVLLYKYFQKAIDFRDSSRQLEQERDDWEMKTRLLNSEVLRVRYEAERRAALLHQQHEAKLALYMRHINDAALAESMGGSSTASTATDQTMATAMAEAGRPMPMQPGAMSALVAREPQHMQVHRQHQQPHQQQLQPHQYQHQHQQQQQQHHRSHRQRHQLYIDPADMEMAGALPGLGGQYGGHPPHLQQLQPKQPHHHQGGGFMAPAQYVKYKPLDKYKADGCNKSEKSLSSTSKIFSKIQMFKTQYRGTAAGGATAKVQDGSLTLPAQLLRHLHVQERAAETGAGGASTSKVTREKKKLVIQQQH